MSYLPQHVQPGRAGMLSAQVSHAGLWKAALISGSAAYRKIPPGCQRGRLSALRPRAPWKVISTALMRRPAASPSLLLCSLRRFRGPPPLYAKGSGDPDSCQVRGQEACDGVIRKRREPRRSSSGTPEPSSCETVGRVGRNLNDTDTFQQLHPGRGLVRG